MAILRPSPPSHLLILLTLLSLVFHSPPVHSLNCKSQKFTNKKQYTNCTQLPTLNSTLYWTYTPSNSSLSILFIAPPVTPNGWVSWAINPTKTGMVGCQTLIAFKDSKGSMMVKTYNITSYTTLIEGKIAFEVPESSAEYSDGVMRIFATWKLPESMRTVNQVWQVGGAVKDGKPVTHAFLPENLKALGKLELVGKQGESDGAGGPVAGGPVAGSPAASRPATSSSSANAGTFWILIIGSLLSFF